MFRSRFVSFCQGFRRDEEGALYVLGLIMMTLMLMMLGFAVDLIRFENTRVRLQNTLDRATLAAASLEQTQDPEATVRDYMLKAGILDQLGDVQVTEALNERIVRATGIAPTNPRFMPMIGIDKFDAKGKSQAQQAIDNVEIALVLDVSGSMSGEKLVKLKEAATEFVDTVLEGDTHHKVSISIVPYNAQVNIGPDLKTAFNLIHDPLVTDVNCVEIPDAAFGALAIPTGLEIPMMAYADIANGTNRTHAAVSPLDPSFALPNYSSAFCKPTTANIVRLPSGNADVLKAQINALQAGGNTSITLGMKWGATMIDPSLRTAYSGFIDDGKMSGDFAGRPFAYGDNVQKVVILMTDGEHVQHYRVTDGYKTGPSPIYQAADGRYSVKFVTGRPAAAGANQFYVPHLNTWQATAWNNGSQQDWRQVWTKLRLSYVAWQFYARPLGNGNTGRTNVYNAQVATMQSLYAGADATSAINAMDNSLQATCNQVRAQGVLLYGITVEAPAHGNEVITDCATSDFTFVADRDQIRDVFQTIAANLTALRLTQ
ncbi:VWA domain-containing protein [Rhodobacter sp. KR11]|uniref:vWA domain-containing protein n=1 Tax=Rhodobacter sp. KR11 TaxID=2974588 RepID=UPI002221B78C|nr:vWA domain-containing protein [Rhodobacter sp. KR11]MCW1917544.1 VWA domain-containing protein [Rhodobacter sp. KR11]